MRLRRLTWILLGLLCLAGVWALWQRENGRDGSPSRPHEAVQPYLPSSVATIHSISTNTAQSGAVSTNKFAYRLSNTPKSFDQLMCDSRAILLENALIDTRSPLNLSIPANLRAQGDPGAYIVQARGPVDNAFRAMLKAAGATIVSYIPNDAYLVSASADVANSMASQGFPVIPYEPYYKISSSMLVPIEQETSSWTPIKSPPVAQTSLLGLAVGQKPLPAGTYLTLGLFNSDAPATVAQIEKLGGQILARDRSPFGPVVRVQPPTDWVALAQLPGVQLVEPSYKRATANDLSRAAVGVSADTQTNGNYLGLTGLNVIVEVNDSGIDANHPDLTGRVFPADLVDTDGHGTHVAGIIAGDGTESTTVTNAPGSILTNIVNGVLSGSPGQFRGKAPKATLLAMDMNASDQELQETPALTNALISNNSWNYGDSAYDLAAASYDAAVRDALPEVTGSQPVLFVFSAGNSGNGDDTSDPGGGTADTIQSPATAKNVITVGAIQEFRNITNTVTNADGTISAPWQPETSTSYRVAGFSSRGNVGIGTEGTYGRYKPDVVAPGTFVVSTRSSQWDIGTYFYQSPTNYAVRDLPVVIQADSLAAAKFPKISTNTVGVTIQVTQNADSPFPFPDLPIYFALVGATTYSGPAIGQLSTPTPDGSLTIASILGTEKAYAFNYAVSNITSEPIDFDIILDTITTNNPGNYFLVLSNLNQSIGTINPGSTGPGPYYRYETGTSMSAADVSGVLALMQDFFTNQWSTLPSPALLKAMLINGARVTGYYDFQAQNSVNYEGWGLINLPSALQPGITNQFGQSCSTFIQDQSPTNALATGDSQTFYVVATNIQPLRITLAWTDPPGDPAAAIKLVNDLNLVVTNLDDPANPIVYYGNDIASGSTFNTPESPNTPANFDSINNVENVYLPQYTGTNFSVTVVGYRVNVNAVTAQTNNFEGDYAPNVVQDYALVISSGNGQITNAMTVAQAPIPFVSNPTGDQQITYVTSTNQPLLNQFVGANTPLMGTNDFSILLANLTTTNALNGVTSEQITIGMTNQWHFYVVTNNALDSSGSSSDVTNAAFVTFIPDTLSIPRMGVFADSTANATREADIDLYVASGPNAWGLTNLDPTVISNCIVGTQIGASVANTFNGASLSRGGTEFVVDTNSTPGQVYYIGVKSEDQMASEYGFIPIFSATPFSQMSPEGIQTVNGVPVPVNIPDGTPAMPGYSYVFGVAIYPIDVRRVVVTDQIWHQNFGDLIGTLTLDGDHPDVLNNHDSFGNPPGPYTMVYDDSGQGDIAGSRLSDGPGSLNGFIGQPGAGLWMLTESDTSLTQTGAVQNFSLTIEPHQDLTHGITITVQPGSWYYDYIDAPPGAISLTITATNKTSDTKPFLELFDKYGSEPTLTSYDESNLVNNLIIPFVWGSVTNPPPLTLGRYFIGIFNPSPNQQTVDIVATLGLGPALGQVDYTSAGGEAPILDDAVTTDSIFVPDSAVISSVDVGLCVEHPRISDLVFHLISPDGTRILLMENRGGTDTNGAGAVLVDTSADPPLTNYYYLVLTENTNLTTTPIKFAPPPFVATNDVATNDIYYLPEQSMDPLTGENVYGTWTLEIQDDRAGAGLTNWLAGWQLRFNFTGPVPPRFLSTPPDTSVDELTLLTVTNTGTDSDTNATLSYTNWITIDTNAIIANGWPMDYVTTNPPPVIDPTTGIITWTPSEAQGPGVYIITTVVSDNSVPPLSATNSFKVTVNEVNTPPVFLSPTNTDVFNIVELAPFTTTCIATDIDIPPNPLTFALVKGPSGLTVSTNGVINWTPTEAQGSSSNTVLVRVTDTNQFAVNQKSFSVTNSFTIIVIAFPNLPTGPLSNARYNQTATLLPNGQVLVVGGNGSSTTNGGNTLSSAELYDPASGTWTPTGSMNNARNGHTATLLPNGQVLVAGGLNSGTNILSSAELYNPATGTWTPTGSMNNARSGPTATLLPNGKVLVAGGLGFVSGSLSVLSSAELFDPATGTWTPTGTMTIRRVTFTATLLPNGQVLVAGGSSLGGAVSSAELYDPASGTWTATAFPMNAARLGHTAILLPNGKVLIAGGYNNGVILSSAELYDPATGTWTPTGPMNSRRYLFTATLLPNGQVLVAGGYNGTILSVAELYDPVTGTWKSTGALATARYNHTATLLANGQVLIVGGYNLTGNILSSAELYDPADGTWTATTGTLINAREYHTATLLPNGQVLVAGGKGIGNSILSSAELYDPATGTWTATTNTLTVAREYHTATLLPNGQVLVAGGYDGTIALNSAELFDPATETWTATTNTLTVARYNHTSTLLPNGQVLVAGGYDGTTALNSAELYDPATGTWTATTNTLNTAREYHTATLLPDGQVLVAGGKGIGNSILSSAELYDPASGTWTTTTGTLTDAREYHTATLLPDGQVLVAGGYDGATALNSAELFDPAGGTWTATTNAQTDAREYHTATLLPNGKVLVAGGYDGTNILSSAELYDPATGTWKETGTLTATREYHTATLLPDGQVLVAGGYDGANILSSAELYDVGLGFSASWQPQIATFTSPLNLGDNLMLTGSQFRGVSEGSGGNTQSSPADHPVVQLRSVEGGQTLFLLATSWSTNSFTSTPVISLPPGWTLVTMFVNGIPSTSRILLIGSTPNTLTGGYPQTNAVASGSINYYSVSVPTNASYATNILLFASAPLNIWFGANSPTTNVLLLPDLTFPSGTNGSVVLSGSTTPPLIPGGIYYLGVQNTNSFIVNYGIEVDFDVPVTGHVISISGANINSSGAQLQWTASLADRFLVEWATNISVPMVWMTNNVIITSSNGTFMFTDPGATNSPMRFYRFIQLP